MRCARDSFSRNSTLLHNAIDIVEPTLYVGKSIVPGITAIAWVWMIWNTPSITPTATQGSILDGVILYDILFPLKRKTPKTAKAINDAVIEEHATNDEELVAPVLFAYSC